MKEPMVSIFWINYNCSSFIDLALESLQNISSLDYSNFELIVVDNCSTDNSFNVISRFIEKKMSAFNVKIVRLPKNAGFNGGNNAAFKLRDSNSEYVVFLNNDAVPYKNSLKELISFIERDNSLGAVEGVYIKNSGRTIEGAGNIISELLTTYSMNTIPSQPHYITYACGTYSVHRISSIIKATGQKNSIFDEEMFAYYDDHILGLKMWNTKSKIAVYPVIAARHKGSSSFGKVRPFQAYLQARALATLNEISNSKYKNLIRPLFINSTLIQAILEDRLFSHSQKQSIQTLSDSILKGFYDGVKIGKVKKKLGETIDIYSAPIARLSPPIITSLIPGIRLSGRAMARINNSLLNSLIDN